MSRQPRRGGNRDNAPRGASPARGGPPQGGGQGQFARRGGPPGDRGGHQPGGGFRGGRGGGGPSAPTEVFAANIPVQPDSRLTNLDALVSDFRRLRVGPEMPLRPGFGTTGTPVMLRSNFFALRLPKKLHIYEYNVKISPKGTDLTGPCKARIFELIESSPEFVPYMAYVAHDRSERLISAKLLPQPLQISVRYFEREDSEAREGAKVYTVSLEFVRDLNTEEIAPHLQGKDRDYDLLPIVSALNLVLQKHSLASGAVRVGQNKYFFPTSERAPLTNFLDARRGFFMSIRPTYGTLMVNVKAVHAAFFNESTQGNLADLMRRVRDATGTIPSSFFGKLRIYTTHLGYVKKRTIMRITRDTPRRTMFNCDKMGGRVSVEKYFETTYKKKLQYADELPTVDVGAPGKPNHLPPEICIVLPDQPYRNKLDEYATAQMITVACNPPATNAKFIAEEGLPLLGLFANPSPNSPLANFGLSVNQEMTGTPARVLNPPQIAYRVGQPKVKDAGWNIMNVKFASGGDMSRWAVLLVQERRRDEFQGANDPALQTFLKTFWQKCQSSGLTVGQGPPTIVQAELPRPHGDPSRQRALQIIRNTLHPLSQQNKPSFVLVLLSGKDNYIYPGLKRLCDMELGLHTVCMLLSKARKDRGQDQYFSNVALKVNVKLKGINHTLDETSLRWFKEKKTMFVGIDVTHPSPSSVKGAPSIAAVVASADDKLIQYPVSLRLQKNRNVEKDAEEMVQDLTDMLVERLILYKKNAGRLPERVIIYRDGVSEGQFDLVNRNELPRILAAFKKLQFNPTLSIIVCGKRHHSQFYGTSLRHVTQNGNTLPGTVVDKAITDIYRYDFYLQAHHGLKGQARPTHYTVVYDENNLTPDQLQVGLNNASYLYARATKAVSLVPPAYYADLACERARAYLGDILDADDSRTVQSSASGESAARTQREQVYQRAVDRWGQGIHPDLKDTMFYI